MVRQCQVTKHKKILVNDICEIVRQLIGSASLESDTNNNSIDRRQEVDEKVSTAESGRWR